MLLAQCSCICMIKMHAGIVHTRITSLDRLKYIYLIRLGGRPGRIFGFLFSGSITLIVTNVAMLSGDNIPL